jgi:hypothetical protein
VKKIGLTFATSLGVAGLVVGLVAGIFAPNAARAELAPGANIFDGTGRYKVDLYRNFADGTGCGYSYKNNSTADNMAVNIDDGSTVVRAYIGWQTEGYYPETADATHTTAWPYSEDALAINFNDAEISAADPANTVVKTAPIPEDYTTSLAKMIGGKMWYREITDLVNANGSGDYSFTGAFHDNCPMQFMIVVSENPAYDFQNVIINDYFYFNTNNTPQQFSLSTDINPKFKIDDAKQIKFSSFSGSFDYFDRTYPTCVDDDPATVCAENVQNLLNSNPAPVFDGSNATYSLINTNDNNAVVASDVSLNQNDPQKDHWFSPNSWNDARVPVVDGANRVVLDLAVEGRSACSIASAATAIPDGCAIPPADAAYPYMSFREGVYGSSETTGFLVAQVPLVYVENSKTVTDENGDNVASPAETLTYKIYVQNGANVAQTFTVQDALTNVLPYVNNPAANVVKITNSAAGVQTSRTVADLMSGINVDVAPESYTVVEFQVKVRDDLNSAITLKLNNTAVIGSPDGTLQEIDVPNEIPTGTPKFAAATKTVTDASGDKIASPAEKLTYTISIANTGDATGDLTVKDDLAKILPYIENPAAAKLTFANALEITPAGAQNYSAKTVADLQKGLAISVAAGKTMTISFQVQVKAEMWSDVVANGIFANTATVDPTLPDTPVENPSANIDVEDRPNYTVSFDNNCTENCSANPANQTVPRNDVAKSPENPTRTGYAFDYYYVCGDETEAAFDFATKITENVELCAKWTINNYDVKLVDPDGNLIDEQMVDYGDPAIAPTPPDRDGERFTGWSKEFDKITGDLIVVAKYEKICEWNLAILASDKNCVAPENTPPVIPGAPNTGIRGFALASTFFSFIS